jgi:predicted ArsR family transcriptional regulator
MTTKTKPTATIAPAAPVAKPPRKSSVVLKLLTRAKGATLAEITEPTGWQQHSARAHLSNLRKQGRTVVREQRKSGETAYRVVETASQPASASAVSVSNADAATNPVTA